MERAPEGPAPHASDAEVRYATAVKCDIVGSTRIKRGLDMDGQLAFKRGLEGTINAVAARHAGHVERFEGDGALIFLGYPQAREDAAESAVRLGLEIVDAIRTAKFVPGVTMQIRVGIASGPLAVLRRPQEEKGEPVAGLMIDMAERLRASAEPDQVVICDATKRLAGRFFEYEDLGAVAAKGFDEGVHGWRVVRESAIVSRFDAQRFDASRSEIIGRADALASLAQAWSDARQGHGRVVCLVGDAGMGKSRLAKAALDLAAANGATVFKLDCMPSTGNTPLFPVGVLLRRIAGITATAPERDKRDLAVKLLERILPGQDVAGALDYLAPMLGLTVAPIPAGHTPDQVRDQTIASVVGMLRALAAQGPLALLCEDLHWADDTTAQVVQRVADGVDDLPVLMIVTSRPDTDQLAPLAKATVIQLQPLDEDTSGALVRSVAQGASLSPDVVRSIVARCEGVPLLLEEVTRSSVEAGGSSHPIAVDAERQGSVPTALKLVVESRLGRRPDLEPIVQAAAVLGREFPVGALEQMLPDASPSSVREALTLFGRHGLFAARDASAGDRARFKHVMFCDAVNEMLLGEDRRRLHSGAADVLRRGFAGTPDASPDVVAEHLRLAERYVESIATRLAASADTAVRGAYVETEGHCEGALALIEKVEEPGLKRELQFKLLVQLGVALTGKHGYASPKVEDAYRAAQAVCGETAEAQMLYPIIRGLATLNLVRGKLATAYDLSLQGLSLAQRSHRVEFRIDAMSVHCYTTLYYGRLVDCRAWIERCLALYREAHGENLTYPVPQDAGTAALALLPTVAWLLGDAQDAEDAIRDGLAHVERLNRDFDRALMHAWIAGTRYTQRRYDLAEQHAGMAAGISQQHGYREWYGTGVLMALLAQCARGPAPDALAQAAQLCAAFASEGVGLNASYYLWGLARGHAQLGDAATARIMLAEAHRRAEASDETRMDAELAILEAELESDAAAAARLLARAVRIGDEQGAVATSLRAAAALALRAGDGAARDRARATLDQLDGRADGPAQRGWMQARLAELRATLAAPLAEAPRA